MGDSGAGSRPRCLGSVGGGRRRGEPVEGRRAVSEGRGGESGAPSPWKVLSRGVRPCALA